MSAAEDEKQENFEETQHYQSPKNETYETTKEDSNNNTKGNQKKKKPSSIETEGDETKKTPQKKYQNSKISQTTSSKKNRMIEKDDAKTYHKKFKQFGLKSLHVLDRNITNPRYPGFSEFFSSNVLRNSSYCWTIGKDQRIKDKTYKKLNDNIYNLPDLKSTRYTVQGFGERKDPRPPFGKGDPSPDAYHIKTLFDINVIKKKGSTMGPRLEGSKKSGKYMPGPGAYNSTWNSHTFGNIPIAIKSRQGFFYDDDLRKKKATVSMWRYKPNYNLVERRRFNAITFGIGDRPVFYSQNKYPGPGSYKVPGNFDRGFKGKLPLN